jgi:hypothetical protein
VRKLTRDEILAMEPGRELDALVAEKVMGWTKVGENAWEAPNIKGYPLLPRYSTDIATAWEVVEKIAQKWHDFNIGRHHGKWSIGWNYKGSVVDLKTAPEAICKAALLARF